MNKEKLILLGGGGHCASVLDSILEADIYAEIVVLDQDQTVPLPGGIQRAGDDSALPHLYNDGFRQAFITVGSVGDCKTRIKLYNKIRHMGFTMPNIIDKTAVISRWVQLGKGIYIGKSSVINARTTIGDCAIINTGAIVEHDCCIGKFAHISPGAVLCGGVEVGRESHIGAGSTIREMIKVGNRSLIGAGSLVVKCVGDDITQYGCPAHNSG